MLMHTGDMFIRRRNENTTLIVLKFPLTLASSMETPPRQISGIDTGTGSGYLLMEQTQGGMLSRLLSLLPALSSPSVVKEFSNPRREAYAPSPMNRVVSFRTTRRASVRARVEASLRAPPQILESNITEGGVETSKALSVLVVDDSAMVRRMSVKLMKRYKRFSYASRCNNAIF